MAPAGGILRGVQSHLGAHGIDLAKHPLTLGPWMDLEPSGDGVAKVESGDEATLTRARYLVHETQRPPYVIPEKV
jgi:hypothetical protein